MITTTKGDLLRADAEALVNTVNTVGVMGKGVALQFKKAFPDNFRAYKTACDRNEVRVGTMFVHEAGLVGNPRFIINFPTKKHWRQPSKLAYIEDGLRDLVRVVQKLEIQSLALPPLGCGHGGLAWAEVRPLIVEAFDPLPDVTVLLFEPAGAPPVDSMRVSGKAPSMTESRAVIIRAMWQYSLLGYKLTILEVQKLAYFLQIAGQDLRLDFKKHHYGPYAEKLRHAVNNMEGHYLQGDGDGNSKPSAEIRVLPHAPAKADAVLKENPDAAKRFRRVSKLIAGFETPYGMELLATAHWVSTHELGADADPDSAVAAVHAWSKRKAEHFKAEHIRGAWERLREERWLG